MVEHSLAADIKPWREQSAEPFIKIQNIVKRFDDVEAVSNVSLDIYKGELFCLLGGSGCGKSTLLRMLAGFEEPSQGVISIDGQDMADVPPYARPTNMMFQSYALFPHMSVLKNVSYGLLREGIPPAEAAERSEEMLRLVKLESYANRKPHQLSGGQRQRVALARALVKQPKLLLLDEPLGALDKKLREETQFELIRIQETLGVTFIVVTHDQEEAMTLATRIAVMDAGEIIQVGEPRQVYEEPNSRYVADFIGSVNMFEGAVDIAVADTMRIKVAEIDADILTTPMHGLDSKQTVWVAVRPERISISRNANPDADNSIIGIVDEVAYKGGQSEFRVRLEGGKMLKVTKPNLLHDEDPIQWDEKVYLSWSKAASVVLTK